MLGRHTGERDARRSTVGHGSGQGKLSASHKTADIFYASDTGRSVKIIALASPWRLFHSREDTAANSRHRGTIVLRLI